MKFHFYDIESLNNVFILANYKSDENMIDLFYLIDDESIIPDDFAKMAEQRIYERNKNFNGHITLYDLKDSDSNSNYEFARTFGLSDAMYVNNPNAKSTYPNEFRLICDTDNNYDEEICPYLLGYNSYHYDTTMLAIYFSEVFQTNGNAIEIQPTSANIMRHYNNELFSSQFMNKNSNMEDRLRLDYKIQGDIRSGYGNPNFSNPKAVIRKNMLMTGRHLDVARLNEKQSKVALKRLLGLTGYQILESDKLRPGQDDIENTDQLLDLIAYNVSDTVNLEKLFMNKTYQSSFTLKKQLLKTYPELIYDENTTHDYKPNISSYSVRKDRLMIDSSSAQFATKSLCPYGHLHDYDTVSFMYPSEAKAKALGIPRVNVLEESKKFFYDNFTQPELRSKFDDIYDYYKSIEGKNFNSGTNYMTDHGCDMNEYDPESFLDDKLKPYNLSAMPSPNTCMFYYHKDGTPSTCFVNFSTGGIHGAEYNVNLYKADIESYENAMSDWNDKIAVFNKAMQTYPNPCDLKINKGIVIDGIKHNPSEFLKPKATTTSASYKDYPKQPTKPQPFSMTPSGSWNVAKRYTFTSSSVTNHEDFTSYYPNMLRMLDAFFNEGLGYDRYGEIFDNKTKYGKLMKDAMIELIKRELYSVMRNGTKLILNSASGAGDANFESNVRMNNKIISMRIIGQLFTWRIGQAQTLENASIISTNTDGLYSVLEATKNNEILARESADIHVEIEPEPIFLISKDSNNRVEIAVNDDGTLGDVESSSGGTLACRKGPTPEKALAHPAIIDWALTEYLKTAAMKQKGIALDMPFDNQVGMDILMSARPQFNDDVHTMIMFQNIIASSPSSQRFVFAVNDTNPDEPMPLQHYNRCFIVKDNNSANVYHLKAAVAKQITDAMQKKRRLDNVRPQSHDPIASKILEINGVQVNSLPIDKEATIVKINGIEDTWDMCINNNDLHMMDKQNIDSLLDNLDYDKYLILLRDSFENNWRNMTSEWEQKQKDMKIAEKEAMKIAKNDTAIVTNTTANCVASVPKEHKTIVSNGNSTVTSEIKSIAESKPAIESKSNIISVANGFGTIAKSNIEPKANIVSNSMATNNGSIMADIELPKMIKLNKSIISKQDLYNGEHALCMRGIRETDAHIVLAEVMNAVTKTNIDA